MTKIQLPFPTNPGGIGLTVPPPSNHKLREDLTPEEKERLEKYGAIEFKSVRATRKR